MGEKAAEAQRERRERARQDRERLMLDRPAT